MNFFNAAQSHIARRAAAKWCCCAIALAGALACAQDAMGAAMVGAAYEPFNYTAGTLIGPTPVLNAGIGWNPTGNLAAPNDATANWGNAAALPAPGGTASGKSITAPGLSFSSIGYAPSAGGKATMDATLGGTGNSTVNVSRLMGGQLVDSGSFFFSYLTRRNIDTLRTTSLSFFGPAGPAAPGSQVERIAIGQIGTGTAGNATTNGNIGILMNNSNPAGVLNATTPIAYGTGVTHLIVGKVDWNASGNETISLWVDPANVTSEATAGAPYMTSNAFELTSFNSIRLFSGNNAAAVDNMPAKPAVSTDYDEIRIGNNWQNVTRTLVPEPTTFSLLLLSSVVFAARRNRRSA
jgi:hypothetical protein